MAATWSHVSSSVVPNSLAPDASSCTRLLSMPLCAAQRPTWILSSGKRACSRRHSRACAPPARCHRSGQSSDLRADVGHLARAGRRPQRSCSGSHEGPTRCDVAELKALRGNERRSALLNAYIVLDRRHAFDTTQSRRLYPTLARSRPCQSALLHLVGVDSDVASTYALVRNHLRLYFGCDPSIIDCTPLSFLRFHHRPCP
jgi:hypothetical protein